MYESRYQPELVKWKLAQNECQWANCPRHAKPTMFLCVHHYEQVPVEFLVELSLWEQSVYPNIDSQNKELIDILVRIRLVSHAVNDRRRYEGR